jgi:hypothetical protein
MQVLGNSISDIVELILVSRPAHVLLVLAQILGGKL